VGFAKTPLEGVAGQAADEEDVSEDIRKAENVVVKSFTADNKHQAQDDKQVELQKIKRWQYIQAEGNEEGREGDGV
jgi:hypothetical protein